MLLECYLTAASVLERITLESILKHWIVQIRSNNWVLIHSHWLDIVSLVIKALLKKIFVTIFLASELRFWVKLWFLTERCSKHILVIIIVIRWSSPVLTLICILTTCCHRLPVAVWPTLFTSVKRRSPCIVWHLFFIYEWRGIRLRVLSRIIMTVRIYLLVDKLF